MRDLQFDRSGRYLSVSGKCILLFKAGSWNSYSKIDYHKKVSTCTRFGSKSLFMVTSSLDRNLIVLE